jgi:signal transduction histidine kinase
MDVERHPRESGPTMTRFSKAIATSALIILICIGALSYWGEVRNENDREWVTHSLFVVEQLQEIRIDITLAESGQRGYLLTGEEKYLKPYQDGLDRVGQDMEKLQNLTLDNPKQQEAILRLAPLVRARLSELSAGIELRKQSGLQAGVEAVAYGNTGGKWMGQIGAQIGEMRHTEAELLSTRLETAAASTRKIKVLIASGNTLAILILLVKGFVIHKGTLRRNLAEENLKQANQRLERRTAELSETNIELESFAYSVAHDLRAPLRHIAGYSGALTQDYGPRLDEEGLRCLGKIASSARQMGRLVDDLLALSQVGRQELAFEETALGSLVAQVVEDLAPESAGRELAWQIGELFSAQCDPGLMKQVFMNLLSNAVKYTRRQEHAVIQVGQSMQNGERVIFIRDNGAGFEMQYADKLFGVFQRLHKARDFEGTGVGLAIVQRIIRKHGGRIWAEAAVDQGATFFFTLGTPEIKVSEQPEPAIHEEEMDVARS